MDITMVRDGRYRYRRGGHIDHRVTVSGRHIIFDGNHHRFPLKDVPEDAEFIELYDIPMYTELPGGVGVFRVFDDLQAARTYMALRHKIMDQLNLGHLSRSDAIDLL